MTDEQSGDDRDAQARDDELLRDGLDRKPSPYGALITPSADGPNVQIHPDLIEPSGLLSDYFQFAREAARDLPTNPLDIERRLLPLMFNYRHAVELALKYALANLAWAIHKDDALFTFTVPSPKKLRDFAPVSRMSSRDGIAWAANHRLGALLDNLLRLHGIAQPIFEKTTGRVEPPSAQAQAFIRELDKVDPSGMAFRYVYGKPRDGEPPKRLIAHLRNVGLDPLIAGMQHIEEELLWYTGMVANGTDLWEQWSADKRADDGDP